MEPDKVVSLLVESATLLGVGMSVVFVFLTLLIVSVNAIAAFCRRFPGQPDTLSVPRRSERPLSTNADANDEVIAAIAAAIHQHRSR